MSALVVEGGTLARCGGGVEALEALDVGALRTSEAGLPWGEPNAGAALGAGCFGRGVGMRVNDWHRAIVLGVA